MSQFSVSSSSGGNGSPVSSGAAGSGITFPSWTEDELRLLEDCMARFPAEDSKNDLDRIIKISKILKTKNIRDIAQKMRSVTSPVNLSLTKIYSLTI